MYCIDTLTLCHFAMLHVSESDNGILRLVCYISDPRSDSRGVPSNVPAVGEVTLFFLL